MQLLVAYLRTADGDAARHAGAILKLLVQRLRQAWPGVRIIVRGDSGFRRWQLMRWCDSNGVGYLFGLARNSRLLEMASVWLHQAQTCWELTDEPQRLFGSFAYDAHSWDRQRRVIVKAEHGTLGDNPRLVVSNLPGYDRGLYEVLDRARGERHRQRGRQRWREGDRQAERAKQPPAVWGKGGGVSPGTICPFLDGSFPSGTPPARGRLSLAGTPMKYPG